MIKNQKGFTLLEIIAVLVILGILAAVAVPRYISLLEEARNSAAQAALAEVKARASGYYALFTLRNGAVPTVAAVQTSVTAAPDLGADYSATTSVNGANITITVNSVRGVTISPAVTGTWYYPTS